MAGNGMRVAADNSDGLAKQVADLEPWLEGPFPIAPGLVAGEAGTDGNRWLRLARWTGDELGERPVLDVGCGAGYDAFEFARRGAARVLACEWSAAIEKARFLEGLLRKRRGVRGTSMEPARS